MAKKLLVYPDHLEPKLKRAAAMRTLERGETMSVNALIVEGIESLLSEPLAPLPAGAKRVEFTPAPQIRDVLTRATRNSGQSLNEVLNALIARGAEAEGMSL